MYLSTESISHIHVLFINILHFVIVYKHTFYFDAYVNVIIGNIWLHEA
jgi:hypothetical protein